jgi:hypothetical protein
LVQEANDTPIEEIVNRLALSLRKAGGELVGACPACGGDDRFAVNPRKNIYNCRGCGGGGGISLVQKALSCDFVAAVEYITGVDATTHVIDPQELQRRKEAAQAKKADRERENARRRESARRAAHQVWNDAVPADGTPAEAYLLHRAIAPEVVADVMAGKRVRFLQRCEYRKAGTVHFEGPAMIACLQKADGSFAGVHRTWLDLDQPKGKPVVTDGDGNSLTMKLTLGSKQGSAIRLIGARADDLPATMLMAEGIETTLSAVGEARALHGSVAAWCASDLGNMGGKRLSPQRPAEPDMNDPACWRCPPRVSRLIYLGDDGPDHKPTRDKLTRGLLRHRWAFKRCGQELETSIAWAGKDRDFNDLRLALSGKNDAAHDR